MIFTPDQKLLILSWKEPYATLMLHGKIETRIWSTKYRGWVLICASKQRYSFASMFSISGEEQTKRIEQVLSQYPVSYDVRGNAIAIGRLVDCRPMERADADKCFVEYFSNLWCHVYEDVKAIQSFPWKGQLGWREASQEVKEKIRCHN